MRFGFKRLLVDIQEYTWGCAGKNDRVGRADAFQSSVMPRCDALYVGGIQAAKGRFVDIFAGFHEAIITSLNRDSTSLILGSSVDSSKSLFRPTEEAVSPGKSLDSLFHASVLGGIIYGLPEWSGEMYEKSVPRNGGSHD
jgi:hypothetical protein